MRGDSRLDFVAKSLALLGLGLVGGVGALIDYWPAPAQLPRVEFGNATLTGPASRPVPLRAMVLDVPMLPSVRPVAMRLTPIQSRRVSALAAVETPARRASEGLVENESAPGPPAAIVVAAAVPARLPLQAFALDASVPSYELIDGLPAPVPAVTWQPLPASAVAVGSDDGFFSGMLKKTGSSVTSSIGKASNSLGKASTSLVGAVRAVGDAVRKAF